MATGAERSLLERRLIIVTGKGGTGKTTVAAALGLAAAERGRRVLLVEVGPHEHLARLFAPDAPPVGYGGRELRPGLTAMRIDPFEAMAEYLSLQVGARSLVDLGLRNQAFRQMLQGAPGWRELITLGKIWHLEQMKRPNGSPLYDLIVVDAPATGHGVTFLDVPRVVHSAVHAGPLGRNAGLVEELVRDPDRTLLLPVTLAEELPAQESGELVARVREELEIAVDRIVINAVAKRPFPTELEGLDRRLAALPAELSLQRLPTPAVMAECASYLASRYALNRTYLGVIAKRTALPVVCLPFLAGGLQRPGALRQLSQALFEPPSNRHAAEDVPETERVQ